jgi:cold shock CspA family protein
MRMHKMAGSDWAEAQKVFLSYCFEQDAIFLLIPKDQMYEGQRQFRSELMKKWLDRDDESNNEASRPASEAAPGFSHIPAVIKWFSSERGFGFGEAGLGQDVFIHKNVLDQAEIDSINEGDTVICDVASVASGKLQAIAVHSVRRGQLQLFEQAIEGVVDFFNAHKGYGFIAVESLPEDVYISARTLENSGVATISSGDRVIIAIERGRFGKGFMATSLQMAPLEDANADS